MSLESRMLLKRCIALAVLLISVPCLSQVQPSAEAGTRALSIGAGSDIWSGDWGGTVHRVGPSAWASMDLWRGLGVNLEFHSMMAGGSSGASAYKFYAGQGGVIYKYHGWAKFNPFVKAELGYGSLSDPYPPGTPDRHISERVWAIGGGAEYLIHNHFWAHFDYTYEGIPDFYSVITGQYHTLNPNGVTLGAEYRFRLF